MPSMPAGLLEARRTRPTAEPTAPPATSRANTTRLLAPLVLIVALFLLPVLTKIKVGDIELEQPAPATPGDVELHTVNWEAIERQVASVATRSHVGTLRVAEAPVEWSTSLTRSDIAQAGSRSATLSVPETPAAAGQLQPDSPSGSSWTPVRDRTRGPQPRRPGSNS
jgi:hypothetical protein